MLEPELTVNITLDMHEEDIISLFSAFEQLPGYKKKDHQGHVYWFGTEDDDVFVCASFGTKGLFLESELPPEDWFIWMAIFIKKTTVALGYEVKII